jgi:hypothetical protein
MCGLPFQISYALERWRLSVLHLERDDRLSCTLAGAGSLRDESFNDRK